VYYEGDTMDALISGLFLMVN